MNIAVFGMGVMGQYVKEAVESTEGLNMVGAVEPVAKVEAEGVYNSLYDIKEKIDVIIDFSHFSNIERVLEFALDKKTALVVATTGFSLEVEEKIKKAGESIPLLLASNTSLGVNVLVETLKKMVPMLAEDYDIEVIEKHHNRKIDAPSGTAKTILETINEALPEERDLVYGREGIKKREKKEIGVHVVRGGTIVGEHSIIFAGTDEVIEIKHEAFSRKLFAQGAVKAAKFLGTQRAGFYTMNNVLGL
jgi:4-hydroxy-tetrahydrodipicolinate reductase